MLKKVDDIGTDRAFLISGHYGFSCTAMEGLVQGTASTSCGQATTARGFTSSAWMI